MPSQQSSQKSWKSSIILFISISIVIICTPFLSLQAQEKISPSKDRLNNKNSSLKNKKTDDHDESEKVKSDTTKEKSDNRSQAQSKSKETASNDSPSPLFNHHLEASVPLTYFSYENVGNVDLDGVLSGFRLNYEGTYQNWFGKAEFNIFAGQVEDTNVTADTVEFNFEFHFGYEFPQKFLSNRLTLLAHGGLGFTFADFEANQNLEVFDFYLPLAIRASFEVSPKLNVSLDLSFRIIATGEADAGGLGTTDMDPGLGFRMLIPVRYRLSEKISLQGSFLYEFRSWKFEGGGRDLDTNKIGVYLGIVIGM